MAQYFVTQKLVLVFGAASALVCFAVLVLEGVWDNGYLWDGMAYLGRMAYMQ